MAFLTLIAPVVALTYPIDRAGDGKAQAFDLWIKEFSFNALLQPLHLLIYIVLVGSAVDLATNNPLYAIVCLGFIIAAEKLLKQMFGFNKASGGTVGSLAGAAGVTALASKALTNFAKGPGGHHGGGKDGKVRTTERTKANTGANSSLDAFNDPNAGVLPSTGNPLPEEDSGGSPAPEGNQSPGGGEPDPGTNPSPAGGAGGDPTAQSGGTEGTSTPSGSTGGSSSSEVNPDDIPFWKMMGEDTRNFFGGRVATGAKNAFNAVKSKEAWKAGGKKILRGANRNIKGAWKAAPALGRKAVRTGLRTASRAALGATLAATAGVIGATTGDGDKAMSMALGAGAVGLATGDDLFEATAGKFIRDTSVKDSFGAEKYGSAIDARNEAADKRFFRGEEFNEYYDKYFKNDKRSKKEIKDAFKSYRQAGITDNDTIRKAMKLEQEYAGPSGDPTQYRKRVQNIVQTKDDIDKKAFSDKKARAAEIKKLESILTDVPEGNRKDTAESIFRGYEDFRRISL